MESRISILMGSDSDLPVVKKAIKVIKEFGINVDVKILSAHRTPSQVMEYVCSAPKSGTRVFIGAAGKAAHLAGVIASHTTLPVIGLPIKSSTMDGLDSLLSTVQMPPGIPVATVAIDGGENAGLLAVQILAVGDNSLAEKLLKRREKAAEIILDKNDKLEAMLNYQED